MYVTLKRQSCGLTDGVIPCVMMPMRNCNAQRIKAEIGHSCAMLALNMDILGLISSVVSMLEFYVVSIVMQHHLS